MTRSQVQVLNRPPVVTRRILAQPDYLQKVYGRPSWPGWAPFVSAELDAEPLERLDEPLILAHTPGRSPEVVCRRPTSGWSGGVRGRSPFDPASFQKATDDLGGVALTDHYGRKPVNLAGVECGFVPQRSAEDDLGYDEGPWRWHL